MRTITELSKLNGKVYAWIWQLMPAWHLFVQTTQKGIVEERKRLSLRNEVHVNSSFMLNGHDS